MPSPPPPPSPSARVQILSDLHLEIGQHYGDYTFPVRAPLLLLGGDVGRLSDYDGYLRFLAAQAARYAKVFLVLGNHEFYGLDYEAGIREARQLCREPSLAGRVVLLHRARWDDPDSDLTVVGCTLWSAIPERAAAAVAEALNDFRMIHGGWTVEKHNAAHEQEVAWLREQVAEVAAGWRRGRRLLVATHHAPCVEGTARPEHVRTALNAAFATDLLDDREGGWWEGKVAVWAFGHTHYSTDLVRNGVRVVANQRGYYFEWPEDEEAGKGKMKGVPHTFDPEFVVTL
ncbi:Metallo-dependent phosphatase-like protein [Xylariaceae sp. FL0804]|nr:Metallo-dependent phosphatase-like protein [Xylariaceae sp. FL0804]